MPSYEMHASVKQVSRSAGRSSVAAAAYRAAACFHDERTGLRHDFTKKRGVEHEEIIAPDNAPDWAKQREWLWNAVEKKETKANATTAHELVLGFPDGFQKNHRIEAGRSIAHEIMTRYNAVVDIALHEPNRNGDDRNFHMHMLFTTRSLDPAAPDGWAKTKFRDLSQDKITVDGKTTSRGQQEVLSLRAFIADELNRIAEREHIQTRTEHLSFEARGIDQVPTQKMGATATNIEREGKRSERGDLNRDIKASNGTLAELKKQENLICLDYERKKRRLEQLIEAEQQAKREAALKEKAEQEKTALANQQKAQQQNTLAAAKAQFLKAQKASQERPKVAKETVNEERAEQRAAPELFDRLKARQDLLNQWNGRDAQKKTDELAAYYRVDSQRLALAEAEREAGRKFGFFEKLLGKQQAAQDRADVLRLNLKSAEQRFKEGIETAYRDAPLPMKNQALQRHGFEPTPAPQAQHERNQAFLERIGQQQSRSVKPEMSKSANDLLSRLEDQGKIKPPAKEQTYEHGNDRQDKAMKDRGLDFERD